MTYNSFSDEQYNMGLLDGVIAALELQGLKGVDLCEQARVVLSGYMTDTEVKKWLRVSGIMNVPICVGVDRPRQVVINQGL